MDSPRRVALLGGTFDPPHRAHLEIARAVRAQADCDEVVFVVAGDPWQKSRHRHITDGRHRLAMVERLVADEPHCSVTDIEVRRAGPTYTIDTLAALAAPDVVHVIVLGADAAAGVPSWHRASDVVAAAEFAVVNRLGTGADVPVPGARVRRLEIAPDDVSSTTIRALVHAGADVTDLVGPEVAEYIRRHDLYRDATRTTVSSMTGSDTAHADEPSTGGATGRTTGRAMAPEDESRFVAIAAARAMDDKKGADIVVMDVSATLGVCDYFVVCSASNTRLARTIVDHVEDELREAGLRPPSREGLTEATWCLLDYGDTVVHVFDAELRSFYNLDKLWSDAPRVDWAAAETSD